MLEIVKTAQLKKKKQTVGERFEWVQFPKVVCVTNCVFS